MPQDKKTEPAPAPAYGSQEYWEQRYQKDEENAQKSSLTAQNEVDPPDAFHSWYFSFEELKPILMPLILGREEDTREEESETENSETKPPNEETSTTPNDEKKEEPSLENPPDKDDDKGGENSEPDHNKPNDDEEDDDWEEVHEDDDDDDDNAVQPLCPQGLAAKGPISVLEIGCGDVPLGTALAEEISTLAQPSISICKSIVCTDYSPTVIDRMKRSFDKKRKLSETSHTTTTTISVDFQVADARKLPYEKEQFQLVLEKGTMDAMISDEQEGVTNCIQIVTECARVLAEGGCFFLVSHINAQTSKGEEWLEQVVLVGLRKGGPNAIWAIEVHGSDGNNPNNNTTNTTEDGGEDDEESPGPAVYLIFKRERDYEGISDKEAEENTNGPSKIPVQFFNY